MPDRQSYSYNHWFSIYKLPDLQRTTKQNKKKKRNITSAVQCLRRMLAAGVMVGGGGSTLWLSKEGTLAYVTRLSKVKWRSAKTKKSFLITRNHRRKNRKKKKVHQLVFWSYTVDSKVKSQRGGESANLTTSLFTALRGRGGHSGLNKRGEEERGDYGVQRQLWGPTCLHWRGQHLYNYILRVFFRRQLHILTNQHRSLGF